MSGTLLRPTVADRGLVALLALLCGCLIAGTAATGLWLRTTADDLARDVFADASYGATQVRVTYLAVEADRVPRDGADIVERAMPPAIRTLTGTPRPAVASPEMVPGVLPPQPGIAAYLTVGGIDSLADAVEVVEGELPQPGAATVPQADLPPAIEVAWREFITATISSTAPAEAVAAPVQVVEVILHADALAAMEADVDDYIALSSVSFGNDETAALLHVVGSYRPRSSDPSPLDDLDTARAPAIDPTPDAPSVRATALAADQKTVLGATWKGGPPDLRWTADPTGTLSAAAAGDLVEQGREVELQTWPPMAQSVDFVAETGLGSLAETVVAQRTTSDGMSLLGLTALAGGGFALLLAAAVVLARRRRDQTVVVRARGASRAWLVRQRGMEALLMVAPGVLAAAGLCLLWPGVERSVAGLAVPLGAAAVTAAVCVALVTAAQTAGPTDRDPTLVQVVARDAGQLALVALAGLLVWLTVSRGAVDPGDPVTLLVAPVVGAAGAVVVLRLLQLLLGGLRGVAAAGRRVTPIVSLSQALDVSRQVVVASGALVLAVSGAAVATSLTDTLQAGASQTGWEQTGSDVLVSGQGLQDDTIEQLAALPGVDTLAPVFTSPSVSLDTALGVEGIRLVAFDPEAMAEVGRGGPDPVELPGPAGGSDDAGAALPVILSPDLELDDDVTDLRYAQSTIPVRVVERRDRIPGVTTGEPFVAVDLAAFSAAAERNLTAYDAVLIGGDPDPAAVLEVVRERSAVAQVRSRSALTSRQLASPAVTRTLALLRAATWAGIVVAGFAVVFLVALGAPVRRRTGTLLTRLGAHPRQGRRIAALGVVPLVAGACVAALGCGALLVLIADRGLDLAALTGTTSPLPVRPDLWSAVVAGLGCVLLVALAAAAAARRTHFADSPDRSERP